MKSRPSVEKRRKELARHEKKREKAAKREQRRAEKPVASESDEDPDIAGIVPGPQPLPDEDE